MAAVLVMAAIGAWVVGTGQISYVVTYGVSMEPVYHAGDLVVVARSDSYEIGQIAAYAGADGRVEVLHRIVGGDGETGFVLQGDNNQSADAARPAGGDLIGRAILHIPRIGGWIQPLLSPTGLGMIGFLLFSGGAATIRTRRDIARGPRKKKVKVMTGTGGSWATTSAALRAVGRLSPVMRTLAVATAACGVTGLLLGALGWMRPATETVSGSGTPGESMTFSYSAAVPRSAAYDGTTAYSPDPIFRRLTNLVDLNLDYRGEPGRVLVMARLSSPVGWHTTIQLSQQQQFASSFFAGTVQLDLNALERRARAAGTAIGADLGQITVAVTAQIRHRDGGLFEPQIPLTLAPLQLSLANGPGSLVVNRSGASAGSSTVDRRIGVLGYDLLTATTARRSSVVLLLAAVFGAVLVAMSALRHVPLRTREQIERRYPHLLVPVEPMASPPGKPVVLVDTFPALVRLAERYGQMILTWTRPDGSDDFVVRDEGITYRFRIVPSPPPSEPPTVVETMTPDEPAPEQQAAPRRRPTKSVPDKAVPDRSVPDRSVPTKSTPAKPPVKRTPAKAAPVKAAPLKAPAAPASEAGAETPAEKPPPRKRAPRRKPEFPAPEPRAAHEEMREEMEDLAERNLPLAAPEPRNEPIYDFLPPAKRQPPPSADS